jgi:proteasome lid subunit RPN8/RPN11
MLELWRRGGERRESGAFLLASPHQPRRVQRWITYDELDPNSLQYAYVRLEPAAFTRLYELCGRFQLEIVADIHTHPFDPQQSPSDRDNPMVAIPGHIALIAPRFARAPVALADVSVNIYGGDGRWSSFFGRDAAALIVAL